MALFRLLGGVVVMLCGGIRGLLSKKGGGMERELIR